MGPGLVLCLEAALCSGLDVSRSEDNAVLGYLHESCLEIKRNEVELKLQLTKKQKSSRKAGTRTPGHFCGVDGSLLFC